MQLSLRLYSLCLVHSPAPWRHYHQGHTQPLRGLMSAPQMHTQLRPPRAPHWRMIT